MYLVFRCANILKVKLTLTSPHTDLVSSSDHRPIPHSLVLTAPFFIPLLHPPHLSRVSSSSSPSSSSPARGTLGCSASGLLSYPKSTQYKALFLSSLRCVLIFDCFVSCIQTKVKTNMLLILSSIFWQKTSVGLRTTHSVLQFIYFTFSFLVDWSPQRWSRPDDSFSVFPELIHWSGFFHFSFLLLGLLQCGEFSWCFRLFSPFLENTQFLSLGWH